MATQQVQQRPQAQVKSAEVDLSKSSFTRGLATAAAAATLVAASANDNLASESRFLDQPREPSKNHVVVDKPKIAFYQVRQGDTLGAIAERFRVPQKEIRAVNPGLDPDRLRIDQSIKLPNVTKGFHIVSPGENPSKIAPLYGVTVKDLMGANPGIDPRHLEIGQALAVPRQRNADPKRTEQAHSVASQNSVPSPQGPSYVAPRPQLHETSVMQASFAPPGFFASIIKTLGFEGGVTRNQNDAAHKNGVPVTNLGVTGIAMKQFIQETEHRTASNVELIQRIENLSTDEAIRIYASGFWRKDFQSLGSKLSFLMFDWGLTSHPTSVIKRFQGHLGVPVTGKIDAATIQTVQNLGETRACESFTECRKNFYTHLAKNRPSDAQFLGGWLARSEAGLDYAFSRKYQDLVQVFEKTQSRGCDLFDPVREGALSLRRYKVEPALIRTLQERLSTAGWTVKVDGAWGNEMDRVVGDFKRQYGLPGKVEWGQNETKVLDAILQQERNKQ